MKISVIIPFYNSEKVVENVIAQLNVQKSTDFEAILIDDCSKDNTYEMLTALRNKMRFKHKILRNENNQGPGITRNKAIANAVGEYITFMDCDDIIDSEAIEILINTINEKNNPDAVIFDYYMIFKNIKIKCSNIKNFSEGFLSAENAILYSAVAVWGKVYKRNLIEKYSLQFPDMRIAEDLVFNKVILSYCDKIYYLKQNLYSYIQNFQGLMHTTCFFDNSNILNAFDLLEKQINPVYKYTLCLIEIKEYLFGGVQTYIREKKNNKEIKDFIDKFEERNSDWYKRSRACRFGRFIKLMLYNIKNKNILIMRFVVNTKDMLKKF